MAFSEIKNQPQAVKILETLRARGFRPPFMIFFGPAAQDKKQAALIFAQACLCEEKAQAPCGQCKSCVKIARGTHPDVCLIDKKYQELVLNQKSETSQLKVETMRRVMRTLQQKPFESLWSIAIVEDAQDLNTQAQNALLKILEEAPKHVLWIWLALSEDYLLPTVISRANFKIYFKPKEPFLTENSGLSLTKRQIFEMSQRVARFRRASQARREVSQILEEIKLKIYSQWQTEGKPKPLAGLKIILRAQQDLDLNLTPALVLESTLLHLAP